MPEWYLGDAQGYFGYPPNAGSILVKSITFFLFYLCGDLTNVVQFWVFPPGTVLVLSTGWGWSRPRHTGCTQTWFGESAWSGRPGSGSKDPFHKVQVLGLDRGAPKGNIVPQLSTLDLLHNEEFSQPLGHQFFLHKTILLLV
jgi:hypothetical protein